MYNNIYLVLRHTVVVQVIFLAEQLKLQRELQVSDTYILRNYHIALLLYTGTSFGCEFDNLKVRDKLPSGAKVTSPSCPMTSD